MLDDHRHEEKPLADILRKRYATDTSRHGLMGKTARRYDQKHLVHAELEGGSSQSNGRRLWTALEVEGFAASHSLDRNLAWEHIPEILHAHCAQPPQVKQNADCTIETTFMLEPVVEEIEKQAPEPAYKRSRAPVTDGRIYQLRPHARRRPALFAVPPTAPPAEVLSERGHSRLLMPERVGCMRGKTGAPLARSRAAFDVTRAGGVGGTQCKLDVDLGHDCEITHLSTQGRPPPTRVFPRVRKERRPLVSDARGRAYSLDLGRRASRRQANERTANELRNESDVVYSVEGRARWRLETHGAYEGPWYDVLDLHPDEEHCPRTGRVYQPHERWLQWVSKYEVFYRQDGGRSWLPLGPFRGNSDATSEVTHNVRGLRARHLRFVPMEVSGGGAMRIGVYGHVAPLTAANAHAHARQCRAADDDDGPQLVKYLLRTCPATVNKRFSHHKSYLRCKCSWCLDLTPRSSQRLRRRLGAIREEPNSREDLLAHAEGGGCYPCDDDDNSEDEAGPEISYHTSEKLEDTTVLPLLISRVSGRESDAESLAASSESWEILLEASTGLTSSDHESEFDLVALEEL